MIGGEEPAIARQGRRGGGATVPALQGRGTVHGREKAARVSPGSLRKPETIIVSACHLNNVYKYLYVSQLK